MEYKIILRCTNKASAFLPSSEANICFAASEETHPYFAREKYEVNKCLQCK